jgi:hypothetical protein
VVFLRVLCCQLYSSLPFEYTRSAHKFWTVFDEEIDVDSIIFKSEIESTFESLEGSSCFGSSSRCSNVISKELEIRGLCADLRI